MQAPPKQLHIRGSANRSASLNMNRKNKWYTSQHRLPAVWPTTVPQLSGPRGRSGSCPRLSWPSHSRGHLVEKEMRADSAAPLWDQWALLLAMVEPLRLTPGASNMNRETALLLITPLPPGACSVTTSCSSWGPATALQVSGWQGLSFGGAGLCTGDAHHTSSPVIIMPSAVGVCLPL